MANKNLEKHAWLSVSLILLLALALRLPLLNGSFWLDEAAQALESIRPLSQQLQIAQDFQPPLLHYLVHFASLINLDEWWLRTVGALIPGLLTIFFTSKIGTQKNKLAGWLAGLFLATSSFHVFYSQELRPYSLPTLFTVWGWWAILKKRFLSFGLTALLGLFSSYLYPFVLLGQLAFIFFENFQAKTAFKFIKFKKFFKQTRYALLAILLFSLWLPGLKQQLNASHSLRLALPNWEKVVSISQLKAIPLVFAKFVFGVINIDFAIPYILLSLILVFLATWSLIAIYRHPKYIKLFFFWLIIPLLLSWLVSFFIPIIRPKRLLFLLPGFYLFLALGWSQLIKSKLSRLVNLARAGICLVLLLNIYGLYRYYTNPQLQRENWRSLVSDIQSQYKPQETLVIFPFDGPYAPWRWYMGDQYQTLSFGAFSVDQVADLNQLLASARHYQRVLIFDYLADLSDPKRQAITTLKSFGLKPTNLIDYPGIGFVREFNQTSDN